MVQFGTVVEHLLIAAFLQLRGRQHGCLLDALTAVEHVLIAALLQGGGGQHELTIGIVYELLGSSKQAVEGVLRLKGIGIGKAVLALHQTHHVAEDLGLHRRTDVDVLRTVVNSSCTATGSCHSATTKRGVDAVELHHVALLRLDIVGTGGVLGNGLLLAVVDGEVDVASQRDAIVEGDGDFSVIQWQERQRRGFIHSGQLLGWDGVDNDFKGYALGNLGRTHGDGGLAGGEGRHLSRLTYRCHGRRAGGIGELDVSRLGRRRSGGRLTYRQRQRGIVDLDVGDCSSTTTLCGLVFRAEDGIDQSLTRGHPHRYHQQEEPVKNRSVSFHTLMVFGYSAAKLVNISETTK